MDKKDQMIMVVKKEILLGANYFQGFRPSNEFDYESIILNNFEYIRRGDAEEDPTHNIKESKEWWIEKLSKYLTIKMSPDDWLHHDQIFIGEKK